MKWTLSAAMLAAALATAPHANAQSEHYRGTFKLPFEARFGKVVLPPGSYMVATLEGAKGIRITGENGNVALIAADYNLNPMTGKAKMILVDSDGMYALQSFESPTMGAALRFLVVKNPARPGERAAAVKPTMEVGMQ
ncbi:MAG: hypothetical protein ABSF22_20560 [Bryobacteraceae bacterium]